MTPLSLSILNDVAAPLGRKTFDTSFATVNLARELARARAFDTTEVHDLIPELGFTRPNDKETERKLAFLPARNTWIEWQPRRHYPDERHGALLLAAAGCAIVVLCVRLPGFFGVVCETTIEMNSKGPKSSRQRSKQPAADHWYVADTLRDLIPMLALINTPAIVGRREHLPIAGLEQKLSSRGLTPHSSMEPWTEIALRFTPPREDARRIEGHRVPAFTGSRALHFGLEHLRLFRGRVVASSRWLGDPVLGFQRTHNPAPATLAAALFA